MYTCVLFECLPTVSASMNAMVKIYIDSWVTKSLVSTITMSNSVFNNNGRLLFDQLDSRIWIL